MKPTPVIAGNWKMYKNTAEAKAFCQALGEQLSSLPASGLPKVVVCPPFTALSTVIDVVNASKINCAVGAQNMESRPEGAYTGEVSPTMLQDVGAQYVIIGHSERRQYYNETDDTVNQKTLAAFEHELLPIVCVGETLAQREAEQTDTVIQNQVKGALKNLNPAHLAKLVMAYEPVWAIGTGKVCESVEANRVCGWIRRTLQELFPNGNVSQVPILYGGSVKPENAQELLAQSDINGALIGGASLQADSFVRIVQAGMAVPA
jgi:triosephosphate isomerase (TIM)